MNYAAQRATELDINRRFRLALEARSNLCLSAPAEKRTEEGARLDKGIRRVLALREMDRIMGK